MERLGLWGDDTPFKSFETFLEGITKRGLGLFFKFLSIWFTTSMSCYIHAFFTHRSVGNASHGNESDRNVRFKGIKLPWSRGTECIYRNVAINVNFSECVLLHCYSISPTPCTYYTNNDSLLWFKYEVLLPYQYYVYTVHIYEFLSLVFDRRIIAFWGTSYSLWQSCSYMVLQFCLSLVCNKYYCVCYTVIHFWTYMTFFTVGSYGIRDLAFF